MYTYCISNDRALVSVINNLIAFLNSLAALGVPGYANHNYNVINLAFYLTSQDTMAEASHVWQNPSTYFPSSYRDSVTGKSNSNDADFRAAIKRMSKRTKKIFHL